MTLLRLSLLLLGILLTSGWSAAAADPTNGPELLWRVRLPVQGSDATPAIAPDGTVYAATFAGCLLAYAPDGRLRWQYQTGREIFSSPAVGDDGSIYFGSRDHWFYALNPDGKLKWKIATAGWVDSSPALGADGTVYFGSWDGRLRAVTPAGTLKWEFACSNLITASPVVTADGTIAFGAHDKSFYALTPDGKLRWKFATSGEIDGSAACGADGRLYFPSNDGLLYALNADGTEAWRLRIGSYTYSSPVIDQAGNLYLAAGTNHVSVSPTGQLNWYHPTEMVIDQSAVLAANQYIYFPTPYNSVLGYNLTNTWPPAWRMAMDLNARTSPALGNDGTIYVADGVYLYACKPPVPAPLMASAWPCWRGDNRQTGRAHR